MRVIITSDTHGQHEQLGVLEADLLLHCGDLCGGMRRGEDELARLDAWFARQRVSQILVVGGNNDAAVQTRIREGRPVFRHALALQDQGVVFDGIRFYGSPWVPDLAGMAYHADDRTLRARWAEIPRDTDVLLTHTPPVGVLDRSSRGESLGCPLLAQALATRAVALHAFGHIHASAGVQARGATTFVNASAVARGQPRLRAPIALELRRAGGRVVVEVPASRGAQA